MAVIEETVDREQERQQELENAKLLHQFDLEKREFDIREHKMTVIAKEATRARAYKYGAIERIALGIIKSPALVVLSLLLPLVILAKREVPEFIQQFMKL